MASVFIIGLPSALRTQLEPEAIRNSVDLTATLAICDKAGNAKLVPFAAQVVADIRAFADGLTDWREGKVFILPYAPIPIDLWDELEVLIEGGVALVGADAGWPKMDAGFDQTLLDALFEKISELIFPRVGILPSQHFHKLARRNCCLLITEGSLDGCDDVAAHRYKFMMSSATAFETIVKKNGAVGPIESFFQKLGLDHAQTGGIAAALKLTKLERCVYEETRSTHLKQGDATTKWAAARVYFHFLYIDEICHIAVLYAGPHPDRDVSRTYALLP